MHKIDMVIFIFLQHLKQSVFLLLYNVCLVPFLLMLLKKIIQVIMAIIFQVFVFPFIICFEIADNILDQITIHNKSQVPHFGQISILRKFRVIVFERLLLVVTGSHNRFYLALCFFLHLHDINRVEQFWQVKICLNVLKILHQNIHLLCTME